MPDPSFYTDTVSFRLRQKTGVIDYLHFTDEATDANQAGGLGPVTQAGPSLRAGLRIHLLVWTDECWQE